MPSSDPRDVLIRGIIAKWAASVTLNNVIGGPWQGNERPVDDSGTAVAGNPAAGTLYPYCLIPDGDDSPLDGMSCASEFYTHTIRFRIYHNSPENCRTQVDLVKAVFDSDALSLTLSDGSLRMHRPDGGAKYVQADKSVWYAELSYTFETQRSRVA